MSKFKIKKCEIMISQHTYSLKNFILTVAIPIFALWSVLFLLGYPLPCIDDIFFTGAAINLAKGGELTNPYIEAWNSILSSGKFYFQPPFHSYTLAGWLKIAGISTASLRLFQYLCYNLFSLYCALILRFYGFPRLTAICTTILFAAWHCNPNPYYSTGFRQDALGMAYLALGLWLLTRDKWWRYLIGFGFVESAVLTSPITAAYAVSFAVAIPLINFIHGGGIKNKNRTYFIKIVSSLVAATVVVFTLFLLCINFDLQRFISDFILHASLRRTSTIQAIPIFINLITKYYGYIVTLPSYFLFISLSIVVFLKRYSIPNYLKILFIALQVGIIMNALLYASAIWFAFFFCWLGIVSILSIIKWEPKMSMFPSVVTLIIYFSSQSLNIISLIEREYVPESQYREIREAVLAKPNRKYAIDEIAARFVFDYKLPKNTTSWTFMLPPVGADPISFKDKPTDVTWIVSPYFLKYNFTDAPIDYPRVEFLGRTFNSLPKKPFDVILIP
uniref:hypothetical protein n=1 Tax=Argonema antarcticum TaxID=2942763 RepID=UPI0030DDD447